LFFKRKKAMKHVQGKFIAAAAVAVMILALQTGIIVRAAPNSQQNFNPIVSSVANKCAYGCGSPADIDISFIVIFSEPVTGVDLSDFILIAGGNISGAAITSVRGSSNEYIVSVNTGTGDGTLRLDVIDNDTIKGLSQNPLGGIGTRNGSFAGGEIYIVDKIPPAVVSIARADSNPTLSEIINFVVTFSENVSGVDAGDFALSSTGNISGTGIAEISGSGKSYTVKVNTGTGDGSLRLDLLDDDSIRDVVSRPLGGDGNSNGNFASGDTYQIDKSIPAIVSSVRADANPTAADIVHFTVTFSEAVNGVDASDFMPATTDSLSGAAITEVSGSGNVYTVTAYTGSGSGSLRLDLIDNDSIMDVVNHPLGGLGAGNGNLTGEIYLIDKTAPMVVSIQRTDANPTSMNSVHFNVLFSESVSGVDAGDFTLETNGSLSGAFITEVSSSGVAYTITVITGVGDGDIRLNLMDDDSIMDAASNPLGRIGSGNGNLTTGETYLIDKTAPMVASIQRIDSNPTSTGSVHFNVIFSESVSGVDAGDFMLETNGNLSGAFITEVSGYGTAYAITATTGVGDGDIRLNLMDDDSIMDAASNPLGGMGMGNTNFNIAEIYTVDKTPPSITGIALVEPNLTGADLVHFTVTFSESVTGLDAGDFTISTTGGVSNPILTEINGFGNTYTVAITTGSGDGTLRLDLLDNDSILDSANNPLGGVGAGNGSYNAGGTYTMDKTAPVAISVLQADPDAASVDVVKFMVIFSEAVSGVDAGDFALFTTGEISGAAVTSLSVGDSPNTYLVTANTGIGNGTIRLDVLDDDSVLDPVGHPLGGTSTGNGIFTGGESYTLAKYATLAETFTSSGMNDGWSLESRESSEQGGQKNNTDDTFNLGDNGLNRQYRAILHFSTDSIPDNAVITSAKLMIKRQGLIGTDPFTTHQNILVDIRSGAFSLPGFANANILRETDFQAPASLDAAGMIQNNPVDNWYSAQLNTTAFPYINVAGITQFRLRFQIDDNNDGGEDYLKFFSGDDVSYRPQLQVEYYVPGQPTPPATTPIPGAYEQYTIEYLRSRTYGGGTLDMLKKVWQEKTFTKYLAKYSSDGLTIYTLVNLPNDEKIHPVIVTIHGYESAEIYDLYQDSGGIDNKLARQGYITVHPAMRNYPPSSSGDNLFRVGQTIDVLNLIAVIKAQSGQPGLLEHANAQRLGVEGSSTGGGVALRILTVNTDVKAAVLYAAISGDERRNVPLFERHTHDPQFAGETGVPDSILAGISPSSYYSFITVPVLLAHGINDPSVPVDWGRETCDLLKSASVNTTCNFYQKAGHLFTGTNLDLFITRMVEFYRKYL
jgi:dienelactone hydrolase